MLVCLEAHCYLTYMMLQLVTGYEPGVFRIYIFRCAFHVPSCAATTYQYGSSKKDVYLLSIMILLYTISHRALARDLFTAHLRVVTFNKTVFLPLVGDKNVNVPIEWCEFTWMLPTVSSRSPYRTSVISKCDEI